MSAPLPSVAVWQTIADMSGGVIGTSVRAKTVLERAPSWVNPMQGYTYLSGLACNGVIKRVAHGVYELRKLPGSYVPPIEPPEPLPPILQPAYTPERTPMAEAIRAKFPHPMQRRCDCGLVFTAQFFDEVGCPGCSGAVA